MLWITASLLALEDRLMGERLLGQLWSTSLAAIAMALIAISVWLIVDWRRGQRASPRRRHRRPQDSQVL